MEALPALSPAIEDVEVLGLVFVRVTLQLQFEMGGDQIRDVDQKCSRALLAILLHEDV